MPVQRVFHPVAVHFKGKGFYNTDYGTKRRARELERSANDGADKHDAKTAEKAKEKKADKAASDAKPKADAKTEEGLTRPVRGAGVTDMAAVPALEVRDVGKRYGQAAALGGVELEVGEGELVGLLGPNGAGKSTLVKIACGLVRRPPGPRSRGRARRLAAGAARARLPRRAVPLPRLVTRRRAARAPPAARRVATAARPSAPSCSSSSGWPRPRTAGSGTMSKGMQQRLGIAQAMVGGPRLLLLDEPTSALDPAGRRTVRALLEELRARGVAVLLNSHLLSEVELVCDRVAIIDRGEVVAAGHAGRAEPRRRGGGRDRPPARARFADATPRGRAADRARAGRRRRGGLRRAGARARRSRTPTSTVVPGRAAVSAVSASAIIAALRAARVAAPARVRRRRRC